MGSTLPPIAGHDDDEDSLTLAEWVEADLAERVEADAPSARESFDVLFHEVPQLVSEVLGRGAKLSPFRSIGEVVRYTSGSPSVVRVVVDRLKRGGGRGDGVPLLETIDGRAKREGAARAAVRDELCWLMNELSVEVERACGTPTQGDEEIKLVGRVLAAMVVGIERGRSMALLDRAARDLLGSVPHRLQSKDVVLADAKRRIAAALAKGRSPEALAPLVGKLVSKFALVAGFRPKDGSIPEDVDTDDVARDAIAAAVAKGLLALKPNGHVTCGSKAKYSPATHALAEGLRALCGARAAAAATAKERAAKSRGARGM